MQMISSCINPGGVSRGTFRRVDEYIYFIMLGDAAPAAMQLDAEWFGGELSKHVLDLNWRSFARAGSNSDRKDRPNLFYPIFVSQDLRSVHSIGESYLGDNRSEIVAPNETIAVWPLHKDGSEAYWMYTQDGLKDLIKHGYFHIGSKTRNGVALYYLNKGEQEKIKAGVFNVIGYSDKDGSVITTTANDSQNAIAPTQWRIPMHNARTGGTEILKKLIGKRFDFPKSLYAVHDTIRFFVANKPNALIVDFFAGSGTTLHAVNLLNKEDGGSRRCIMVTNNEVSADESEALSAKGFQPGDEEWEKLGIARYVNWPRTQCSILGIDVNGNPISGEYLTTCKQTIETDRKIIQIAMDGNLMSSDAKKSIISLLEKSKIPQNALTKNNNYILGEDYTTSILFNLEYMDEWLEALEEQTQVAEIYIVTDKKPVFNQIKTRIKETLGAISKEEPVKFPMSDGFKANAAFFKLGFLDKNAVALGHQFKEILSTLWMKAGAIGACPVIEDTPDDMLILPKNRFAVLLDETMFNEFAEKMQASPDIQTIYFITDSEKSFRDMSNQFANTTTYQLYRDYLDNFRINIGR